MALLLFLLITIITLMKYIISGKSSFFPNIAVLPRWVFCFHHDLWIPLETQSLDVQKAHIHPGPAHWEKTVVTLHTYTGLSLEKGMLPSPLFLPQKSHGQRSLVGYRPRGRKESDKDRKTKLPPPHTTHIQWYTSWMIVSYVKWARRKGQTSQALIQSPNQPQH